MRDGATIRVPGFDFDVHVVIDPECEHRGIVRYGGYQNHPVIVLREPHERVFLHEVIHVLVASDPRRTLTPGTEQEELFVRHLTHLHDLGWRYRGEASETAPITSRGQGT